MDNSSSEESSSEYSTESSEDDGMETAQINDVKLQLPHGLCEKQEIFREIISTEVWNSLSDENRQHLQTFLPNFPENDDLEKTKTLQRLFDCDVFHFNSPVSKFHDDLKAGYFRPDIARMRKIIHKAERKEAKYRYKTFREQLKYEVFESRNKLLTQVKNLPPGVEPRQDRRKSDVDYVSYRTKRRYFQILSSIRSKTDDPGCSSDENYPDGPPVPLSRKQKRLLNSIKTSLSNSKEKLFTSTMTANLNGSIDLESHITPNHNPFYINDETFKNLLYDHRRRKCENPLDPELNTKGITLKDVIHRTQLPYNKNLMLPTKHDSSKIMSRKRLKREHINGRASEMSKKAKLSYDHHSTNSDTDSDSTVNTVSVNSSKHSFRPNKLKLHLKKLSPSKSKVEVKKEAPSNPDSGKQIALPPATNTISSSKNGSEPVAAPLSKSNNSPYYNTITPVKIEDLDGIDVMNIPIDLDNTDIDILDLNNKPELMQETHANFFSLIRDIICSTSEHRMNMYTLQERLKTWQDNPISPLNDWYNLTDSWINVLPSAITFLCGNASEQPDDFVPYMEYKISLDVYQWIAGRDSDALLSELCGFWLEHRTDASKQAGSPGGKEGSEAEVEVVERCSTPPPSRCPTNWTVRKATPEEIRDFREQEKRRYDNPHKAFTYRCNNYESVVGPLKGIYTSSPGNTKARGHTMLSADRPNFVTILSLVRDAAARLPNGEGTRAEICELLKASQYISSTAPDNILQQVVSGALDRMHTQFDPCVKYDPKRKIWIYLHRNRTEEDFERLHHQYQGQLQRSHGVPKVKKPSTKKSSKPKEKQPSEKLKVKSDASTVSTTRPNTPQHRPPLKATPPTTEIVVASGTQNLSSNVITMVTASPTSSAKGASLLLHNNVSVLKETEQQQQQQQQRGEAKVNVETIEQVHVEKTVSEADVNEALQVFMQNRNSPSVRAGKSLMKIIPSAQGKSLILSNPNAAQLVKQHVHEQPTTTKQLQPSLQPISTQTHKLSPLKQTPDLVECSTKDVVTSVATATATAQQLQNIKNVTLLRTSQAGGQSLTSTSAAIVISAPITSGQSTLSSSKVEQLVGQPNIQIKGHKNLSPARQQQILQTIKQKILPNSALLSGQQQIILKKGGLLQVQKQNCAVSAAQIIAQQKIVSDTLTKTTSTPQGPVVAKVLTNASGQVISVESLLAHQKQHGSLPQGTTLRVSSTKGGQQNLIHLTGSTTKQNAIAQLAVGSQATNILTLTSQPKLVMASQASTITSMATTTKPTSKAANKTQQMFAKLNAKAAQQLITSEMSIDGQKIVPSKIVIGQQNQVKLPNVKNVPFSKQLTLTVAGNANNIRMVNAANLNLTQIAGKPVLLASKGGTVQNFQGQNVVLQSPTNASGGLVFQSAAAAKAATATASTLQQQANANNLNLINQSNLVFSPQVKVQQPQQVVFSSTGGKAAQQATAAAVQQGISQGHIVIGGHPVRLQSAGGGGTGGGAAGPQRVVLASQGQGGQIVAQQILLPAGFQGTAINIKALQGVKVIPLAQAHAAQGKGAQGRQVFARVMSPSVVKQTTLTTQIPDKATDANPPSSSGE
ncbi:unnamed protein product [Acanthoscelides obtectus]|uniref:DEUBAD domain-containing protein n=1 Tax=Acanthoscelides obtectus TaxID=200917 RepID=A0A9P0PH57_ACAOB|nr:unnamed protein product [Acanthoscelides obtectus]CAK1631228.1 Nuclear factor related to kappa-B-binding protein [Acanthoscelides obtectus]